MPSIAAAIPQRETVIAMSVPPITKVSMVNRIRPVTQFPNELNFGALVVCSVFAGRSGSNSLNNERNPEKASLHVSFCICTSFLLTTAQRREAVFFVIVFYLNFNLRTHASVHNRYSYGSMYFYKSQGF